MERLSLNERINKQWDKCERYRRMGNELYLKMAEDDLNALIAERDGHKPMTEADIHAGEQ